jgi:hypothetical protein
MPTVRIVLPPDEFEAFHEWKRLRDDAEHLTSEPPSAEQDTVIISTAGTSDTAIAAAEIPEWLRVNIARATAEGKERAKAEAEKFASAVTGGALGNTDPAKADAIEGAVDAWRRIAERHPELNTVPAGDTAATPTWRGIAGVVGTGPGETGTKSADDTPDPDATDKRIDAVLEHVNDLVGLLNRLTVATNKIATRLTALEAVEPKPTAESNLAPGQTDPLSGYANPPPVETVNGWRLNVGPKPELGRRIEIISEYPQHAGGIQHFTNMTMLDEREYCTVIAWRYAK